jgi:hypothetical protein
MSKDRQSPNGSFTEYTSNLTNQIQTSYSLDNIKQLNNKPNSPSKSNTYAFLSSNVDPYASPKKASRTTLTASISQTNVIVEETSLDKENLQPSEFTNKTPEHSLTSSGNHANFSSTLLESTTTDKPQLAEDTNTNNSLSAHINTTGTTALTAAESFQTPNDSISFYSTPLNHNADTTDTTNKQELDSSSNLSPIQHMKNIDTSSSSSSSNLSNSNMPVSGRSSSSSNNEQNETNILNMINKDMQAAQGSPLSSSNSRNGDESSQALVTASEGKLGSTSSFFFLSLLNIAHWNA